MKGVGGSLKNASDSTPVNLPGECTFCEQVTGILIEMERRVRVIVHFLFTMTSRFSTLKVIAESSGKNYPIW
ncbi:hypothetical protein PILCRDRAFT_814074 [Piloderma croceum F 1598]|uniref:Uncharacterized protein n=1 Tax=Piloderma croceum (strain F 1598) TaxID=765440 RepID=A0A0C3CEL1_PILCF|nr:hypothetical protein PILCRDRAFT_814074 [Piloderma croceum F 1598]